MSDFRREGGRISFKLALAHADRLCRLPREFLPDAEHTSVEPDAIRFEYLEHGFQQLLLALGSLAGGYAKGDNWSEFWAWIALANAVNEGNPQWQPYEIPAKAAN